VCFAPKPNRVPVTVPASPAAIEPTLRGMKIRAKPPMSTLRSIPRMLPTMIMVMNRYRKFVSW